MPKSGSTFFSNAISSFRGVRRVSLVPDFGAREQELERGLIETACADSGSGWVAQHHVRCSGWTRSLIVEYGIKPIVLVRSLADAAVSLIDHHAREGVVYPAAIAPSDLASRPFDEQARFVVRCVMPWYVGFWASWFDFEPKLVIRYEDMAANPEAVLRAAYQWCGGEPSANEVSAAIQQASGMPSRFNVGTSGRGALLPHDCRQSLAELVRMYPNLPSRVLGYG